MARRLIILLAMSGFCMAAPQFIVLAAPSQTLAQPYQHPAVLVNSIMEANLPYGLRNNFYDNPRIAADLAQASLLHEKEMQVVNRATDNIPREKIYKIISNAGFVHG